MTAAATTTTATPAGTASDERADLLQTLHAHRAFLRVTVQGLTDEQARQQPPELPPRAGERDAYRARATPLPREQEQPASERVEQRAEKNEDHGPAALR